MKSPLRLGISGLGHMGKLHLQKARQLPEVEVVAVYDPDPSVQAALAEQSLPVMPSYEALLDASEAVIIASPTAHHFQQAATALRARRHILIEKPIVTSASQLEELSRLWEEAGVVALAGHVERFNPAFQALLPYQHEFLHYTFERVAPWTPRGSDASVVLDLAIHDIDLFWALTGASIADMRAVGYRTRTLSSDTLQVWIDLVDGRSASFLVSRDAPFRRRRIMARGPDLWAECDLVERSCTMWRKNESSFTPMNLSTSSFDPLTAELEHFLHCIHTGEASSLSLEHVQGVMFWVWRVEALAAQRLAFTP
ncbi:MAG: Gfo/Idh/MocA family oxidoreductase [Bacteroidia bacterium]|nr:Gfo/Idh/MocA family oxidoreductase [Bacteroidia bacterium]MDW8236357.1 Gfo/Idh/MocA family oxidoreductase [Bacteroidia bacterium]